MILTTGTFLNGLIHIGEKQFTAGRNGEPASVSLGKLHSRLGFRVGPAEDGNAAAAGPPHDRFFGV